MSLTYIKFSELSSVVRPPSNAIFPIVFAGSNFTSPVSSIAPTNTNVNTAISTNVSATRITLGLGTTDSPSFSGATIGSGTFTVDGVSVGLGGGGISTNTAVGFEALNVNSTGADNLAVGYRSLVANTTGVGNCAVGTSTLFRNTTGIGNTAFGLYALFDNASADYNTAIGSRALLPATGGSNTAVGRQSLGNSETGTSNTAIGLRSGNIIADGSANAVTTNSIYVGSDTRALANNQTNQLVIGHQAVGLGSNTATIGNSSTIETRLGGTITTYGTYTDPSNYRRLALKMSTAGVAQIVAEGEGAGAVGNRIEIDGLRTTDSPTFRGLSLVRDASNSVAVAVGAAGNVIYTYVGTGSGVLHLTNRTGTFNSEARNESTENASAAIVATTLGTGDAYTRYTIPSGSWTAGIDNSDADKYKVGVGATVDLQTWFEISTTGESRFFGNIQATGYKSSDGSTGATGSFTAAGGEIVTVKNGLITNISAPP